MSNFDEDFFDDEPKAEQPKSILKKPVKLVDNLDFDLDAAFNDIKPAQPEPVAPSEKQIELKNLGLNEKIYKFSDLYIPQNEKVRNKYMAIIDSHSSRKVLRDFEKKCVLPGFDLTESIAIYKKRVKTSTDNRPEQVQNTLPETGPFTFELSIADSTPPPMTLANSFEFFDYLSRELDAEWRNRPDNNFEDYTTLLKTISEARKEKIEEEKNNKRIREMVRKRNATNQLGFDSFMANHMSSMTPNFGAFATNNFEEQKEDEHNANQLHIEKNLLVKRDKEITQNRNLEFDQQAIRNFEHFLRNSPASQKLSSQLSCEFSSDLSLPNFFTYKMIGDPNTKLSLDIYAQRPSTSIAKINKPTYSNPLLKCISSLQVNQLGPLTTLLEKFPYLDVNDPYFGSLISNFDNEKNEDDKAELPIVIDDKKTRVWEKDSKKEIKANRAKKLIRLTNARQNKHDSIPEENRREILENTTSELRHALDIDKTQDMNKTEEMVSRNKRKAKPIHHCRVAEEFLLHDFVFDNKKILNLYRSDYSPSIIKDLILTNQPVPVTIVNKGKDSILKKKLNTEIAVESYKHFDSVSRLSLKSDPFELFEYVEKDPLILSDIGMASRLERLIYVTRLANRIIEEQFPNESKNQDDFLHRKREQLPELFRKAKNNKFGARGEDVFLAEDETIPFIGQLTKTLFSGCTLLDSPLSATPVFTQKTRSNDFLLVIVEKRGQKHYYLRRIESIYVAGQIEPKQEVFSPYSRQYTNFQTTLHRFYINMKFKNENRLDIENLKQVFPDANEHNLRRQIKAMGGEELEEEKHIFVQKKAAAYEQMEIKSESDLRVTPEEICLYQRMKQSLAKLAYFGITELKSTDKISVLKTKYYRKNIDNIRKTMIARRILEEIQLSAWNVSQSFLICKQGNGRMYLTGFGDPTNGHGGINFIKLPQKISRIESLMMKSTQRSKPHQTVTGTTADLRSLNMDYVHKELRKHGYKEDILNKLERWDKIELLKKIANDLVERGESNELTENLLKFSRNQRMTTEKQKEKYQSDINALFMKMIETLSNRDAKSIKAQSEIRLEESLEKLMAEQKEEMKNYKQMESNEEGASASRVRNPKQKSIVLRHCIKKT